MFENREDQLEYTLFITGIWVILMIVLLVIKCCEIVGLNKQVKCYEEGGRYKDNICDHQECNVEERY